ncbi:hypothetical protein [Salinisphaera sp.]|uniref:hypothetical protein n=1 Tax=Salinisphaera sp. TaxID=1914330 RepID=UPI003C7A5ADA
MITRISFLRIDDVSPAPVAIIVISNNLLWQHPIRAKAGFAARLSVDDHHRTAGSPRVMAPPTKRECGMQPERYRERLTA